MSESAFYNININGAREPGESFKDFKKRLKSAEERRKLHKKGRVIWDSLSRGTYVKKLHGPLR